MDKITIVRYSFSPSLPKINESILTSEQLKQWVVSGKILTQLFRYRNAIMLVYRFDLITKPFLSALLIRLLARKKALFQDASGASQEISSLFLVSLFFQFFRDRFRRKKVIEHALKKAQEIAGSMTPLDLNRSPVYLRTDLCFGLVSGGSIAHIAGILNNLNSFTAKPIFLTSDLIPTVSSEWETHVIFPLKEFWDFKEILFLHFNDHFFRSAIQILGNRRPSFIYQRYSLHNYSGLKLAAHFKVPFVLEFNGSEVWINSHWGTGLKHEKIAEQIESINLQAAQLIVVVSQPIKDALLQQGIDSHKILVNPNGVDSDKYSPSVDGTAVRKKLHMENKLVIGFIGTFGKWHGAEVLTEAFGLLLKQHPELKHSVRLLMIGDGNTMPLVKQEIGRWNLSDYSSLTGIVAQEKGPDFLAACDLLVAPHVPNPDGSPFFGSPTKLFEYMAMGKAIVASDLDQIGEILHHNHTAWLVKPGDAASLAKGLKTLIDDEPKRARLGQAARQEAISKYTWKEHTRKIVEKLKEMSE